MADNNYYFETLKKMLGEMTEESLVQRIADCDRVVKELTENHVWLVVLKDASNMVKRLDDTWQDLPLDSPQLKEMRILKLATKHILDLPIKYAQDLDVAQEELSKRQKPEESISKDYDNEGAHEIK